MSGSKGAVVEPWASCVLAPLRGGLLAASRDVRSRGGGGGSCAALAIFSDLFNANVYPGDRIHLGSTANFHFMASYCQDGSLFFVVGHGCHLGSTVLLKLPEILQQLRISNLLCFDDRALRQVDVNRSRRWLNAFLLLALSEVGLRG